MAAIHVLPARAGMIPKQEIDYSKYKGAPRTSGDDPGDCDGREWPQQCSPHERG